VTDLRTTALASKAWPYEEARKLLKRVRPDKPIVFETGYGPSGLPHIGTFNEVLRTTMVRHAFEEMTERSHKTELIAFSDDMDGLRKVPDNVPNQAMLTEYLGKPLSRIPDPFGTHESFAAHNNAMLCDFLDQFEFEYEFISSSSQYESGAFDEALKNVLRHYQGIMDIMLPTLRKERAATYSPVLPISEKSGIVLQVPVEVVDAEIGLIAFDDDGERVTQSILGGKAKLQWKVDWAMRWVALGVDYEMYGKDLTDSGTQSGKIAQVLGGRKPEGLIYEMFLDEKGEKISKSKGNGLALEDWLKYAPKESVAFYAYREPKSAKQLHLGIIPTTVDEYFKFCKSWNIQKLDKELDKQLGNPVHHVHNGNVPDENPLVTFGLILNLVGVLGPYTTPDQVRSYLRNYIYDMVDPPEISKEFSKEKNEEIYLNHENYVTAEIKRLDALIIHAIAYNRDIVSQTLQRRKPTKIEAAALNKLCTELKAVPFDSSASEIQDIVYAVGKESGFENLRDWFKALYETLLGSSTGPRMGSFIALYGIEKSYKLIEEALG
jgi:lysyl-tRNA synthetase, class I